MDRQAKDLGLSRDRYIVRALEQSLRSDKEWSPAFLDELRAAANDVRYQRDLAAIRAAIRARRTGHEAPSS